MRIPSIAAGVLCVLGACAGKSEGGGGDTGTDSGISTAASSMSDTESPSSSTAATQTGTSATEPMTESSPPMTESASMSESTNGEGDDGPNVPDGPVPCGNQIWECGDTKDNDGDGHIDLFDPECTGPCDNDESSFQTGIPGDNVDCRQDCFFDGNSGQGDAE